MKPSDLIAACLAEIQAGIAAAKEDGIDCGHLAEARPFRVNNCFEASDRETIVKVKFSIHVTPDGDLQLKTSEETSPVAANMQFAIPLKL